jgi:thymidine kinase
VKRLKFANKKILVFKPLIDDRYTKDPLLVSHSKHTCEAILVKEAKDILQYDFSKVDAVIIDEAQFFDQELVSIVSNLANQGLRVIIGGLDLDFKGQPFGPMPYLLALAEYVTKLTAICSVTGKPATKTQRLINGQPAKFNDPIIVVGASESYEPRSRIAHEIKYE